MYETGRFSKDRPELADGALNGDWETPRGERPRGPISEYAEWGLGVVIWRPVCELGVRCRLMDASRSTGSFCSGYEFREACPLGVKPELASEEWEWWWYWSRGTRWSACGTSSSSIRPGALLSRRLEGLEDDLEPGLSPEYMVATCGCCICDAWPELYPGRYGRPWTTGWLDSKASYS
jgi:hypothetical protein